MKKFVSLVLAAALSASVLGCAGEKPAPAPVTPPADKAAPAPDAPATPAADAPAPEGEKK